MDSPSIFKFKKFEIVQDNCNMKVNTDGILLGAWSETLGKRTALDIGTGTGIIAIMLAQKNKNIKVTGIDIDKHSLQQAGLNMDNSPYKDRLVAVHSSVQDFLKDRDQRFELIVSNPPFFTGGTFSSNENKANVRHTFKLPHSDLLRAVQRLLDPLGHFDLILPYLEGLRFIELADQYKLYVNKITEVKSRPDRPIERLLIRLSDYKNDDIIKDQLIIYKGQGPNNYTLDFSTLTRDFYLFL